MNIPLVTLTRQSRLVWLSEGGRGVFARGMPKVATGASETKPVPANDDSPGAMAQGQVQVFRRAEEAQAYLWFWRTDVAAVVALRHALYRCDHSPAVFAFSDLQVFQVLAARLAHGALVVTQSAPLSAAGSGWPEVVATQAGAPGAGATATSLVSLSALSDKLPLPPLLPLLEELQMEGAEVLPEIEQTLEQIALTMDSIDLAGVSLAPTPSKIPLISSTMTEVSRAITQTLGEL